MLIPSAEVSAFVTLGCVLAVLLGLVIVFHQQRRHVARLRQHNTAFQVELRHARLLEANTRAFNERLAAANQFLERRHHRLSTVLDAANEGIWEWNVEQRSVRLNDCAQRLLSAPALARDDDLFGLLADRVYHDDRTQLAQFTQDLRSAEPSRHRCDVRVQSPLDGSTRWLRLHGSRAEASAKGGLRVLIGLITDITQQKRVEQELRDKRETLEMALDAAKAAVIDVDLQTLTARYSDRGARMLGYELAEMPASFEDYYARIHPEDIERIRGLLASFYNGANKRVVYEHRMRRMDGTYIWVESALRVTEQDAQGCPTRFVGIRRDITERKELEERLASLAMRDPLTGLANRTAFNEALDRERARAERRGGELAVLFLDLDRFKPVNDRYGHAAGDTLLRLVAARLKNSLRATDLIARLGGDEFAILAPSGEQRRAYEELAQRLVRVMAERFEVQGIRLNVGLSVGITVYPHDNAQAPDLLVHADAALYEAKAAGRNTWRRFQPTALTPMTSTSEVTAANQLFPADQPWQEFRLRDEPKPPSNDLQS